MTLRVLIADDEPLARARLRALVQELGHEVCAEATDGKSAEAALQHVHPDVLLLDVEMPGTDGLTIATRAQSVYPGLAVVLVTAHREHALAAFDVPVQDYVLKPVRKERLERALARISVWKENLSQTKQRLMVRVTIGRKERLLPLDDIAYFVADHGYVVARSAALQGFVDLTLTQLEDQFGEQLLRVHRSCVVVKTAIAGLETHGPQDHRVIFKDGLQSIAVSRRQVAVLRSFLRKRSSPS